MGDDNRLERKYDSCYSYSFGWGDTSVFMIWREDGFLGVLVLFLESFEVENLSEFFYKLDSFIINFII